MMVTLVIKRWSESQEPTTVVELAVGNGTAQAIATLLASTIGVDGMKYNFSVYNLKNEMVFQRFSS